ncbi:MarR family winged helix-turn-helix transcriptional regulator [Liquorilactobacillus satsumensis]|uniref:Transcriptional regulator n=1 Tax=Liquorilactobacillus satsumensis DSM 16230 = JCM 12392 TaxID=1423801 RepID=A0A0R1V653_9LACO|nr:MarR family transcriptional regulator [Liquorilactobacillus satsumensis]KRL98840.1 transcriptional regulator [Liquorilactobacillus satsumensis DSM 16230 = JCM 12392]MCC7666326.1 transcriptional regulator [Liquorilactobacillus satsumensis]MCP9312756.1 MarR family transcriptional regulator [Liquorilactobacillus satsumensis]MCP9327978.1 MarR family transcriptional regulator [Liquorilactobacillus satsumensis]MCP9358466.1 MarR family transcriptional regulator [Liquorilactobacillus satsumensis]
MERISQIFSELYDKVLIKYQNSPARSTAFPEMSANDEHYIDLLYTLKNATGTSFAIAAKISKPAATRIIQRFIAAGYLTKHPSKQDKRISYLTLTKAVRNHCRKNYQLFDSVFLECTAALTKEEQAQLQLLLRKINQKI